MKKHYVFYFLIIALVIALFPEIGFAQSVDAKGQISKLFLNPTFKMALDLGLIMFAGYQWFMYFNNFNPSSAFKDVIIPSVITWFAFQWTVALSWVGIISI